MKFKYDALKAEYEVIQPTLRGFFDDFEAWCRQKGFPEPMATHIKRTRDNQEEIYWRIIFAQGKGALTEAQARYQARNRWTWHFVLCAVDLRDFIYTEEQMKEILAYLKEKTKDPKWEFLYHDVGRGKHLHIGIRDPQWAKNPVAER